MCMTIFPLETASMILPSPITMARAGKMMSLVSKQAFIGVVHIGGTGTDPVGEKRDRISEVRIMYSIQSSERNLHRGNLQ